MTRKLALWTVRLGSMSPLPALWGYWLAHMMRCIQSTWERSNV
jgi:hypothetical protein